jgi:DivIVA domain-containing protein
MALTSEEIATKEFLTGLRGYDKDEVRSFLQTVAGEFESAGRGAEAAPAPAAPAAGAAAGGDWSNLGDEIAAVLRTAHDQAATLRGEAETEAAKLRGDAQSETSKLRADAEADAARLRDEAQSETSKLRADAEADAARLRSEAEADAARARADADQYAQALRAEAEQNRNDANHKLTEAQEQALTIVGDAQERVDKMVATSRQKAEEDANAAVAHLTAQVKELASARDSSRHQLAEVRGHIDQAIAMANAEVPSSN